MQGRTPLKQRRNSKLQGRTLLKPTDPFKQGGSLTDHVAKVGRGREDRPRRRTSNAVERGRTPSNAVERRPPSNAVERAPPVERRPLSNVERRRTPSNAVERRRTPWNAVERPQFLGLSP